MDKKPHPARRHYPVADSPFWLHVESLIQRYGAILLGLIVLAGLSGFFSQGWFSAQTSHSADRKITVQYDRFGRLMSDFNMQLVANAPAGKQVVFALGGDFMHDFEIRTLQPQPEKMYSQGNELILEYSRTESDKPFTVWLGVTALGVGSSMQRFTLNGASPVTLDQFIWP